MAVCSILYQLATRPDQQEKLHEELVRILPDPETPLNAKLLDQMVFLKAFVKEVFRYVTYKVFRLNDRLTMNISIEF